MASSTITCASLASLSVHVVCITWLATELASVAATRGEHPSKQMRMTSVSDGTHVVGEEFKNSDVLQPQLIVLLPLRLGAMRSVAIYFAREKIPHPQASLPTCGLT